MKKVRNFILLLLALVIGYLGYNWFFKKADSLGSFALVPNDAVFVVETEDVLNSWSTFSESKFWQHIKKYGPLGDIGKMADGLDELLSSNKTIFKGMGRRHVLISAHVVNKRDYDFMYICDISGLGTGGILEKGIQNLMISNGFKADETEQSGHKIMSFQDPKDKSVLSMAVVGDKLICSYKFGLILRSLGALNEPSIVDNPKFAQINSETATTNVCKLYLNYNFAGKFMGVYSDDVSAMEPIFESMQFTGVGANITDDILSFKGFTNLTDSSTSYLQALSQSGNSKMRVQDVMPQNTSYFLRLGFESFGRFRNSLLETLEENPLEKKSFTRTQKLLEGYLGLKLEEDFMGWIDNEIAMAQFQQSRYVENKLNTAIFVKSISAQLAEEKFAKIEKRIAGRTPIKMSVGDYKGHKIRQLKIKGLFGLFFGKAFDKVNSPYFTNVGDYMVFSDDAKTLLNIVDDFDVKLVLSEQEDFGKFKDEFSLENSMYAYVNMPRFVPNMRAILSPESYAEMERNTEYVMYFKHMGLELEWNSSKGLFNTRFCTYNEIPDEETRAIRLDVPKEFNENIAEDSLTEADDFIIMYINGNAFKEYYDNGKLKYIATRKNGLLHGRYKEYWENGNPKAEGKYRGGEKKGKWKFYSEDGQLERTEDFSSLLDDIKDQLGL
jgi:hypothetical protein